MRNTWFKNSDYTMSYELIGDHLFIHLVMDKVSKSIITDIKDKWNDFVLKVYMIGYEHIFTYTKDIRIVNIIGGGEVVGNHEDVKVIAWELK